ncbi:MAG: PulJ/GspJ family protein [Candidatus Saccharimonadales bacterium]
MRLHRQSGMTLVELLIATTITALLFTGMAMFTGTYLQNNAIETARSRLLADNIDILDQITEDIRQASGADENNRYPDSYAPGGSGSPLSWASNDSTLILATIAVDGDKNVIYEDTTQYVPALDNVIYFISGGVLYRRTLAGPADNNAAVTTCPVNVTECAHDRTLSKYVSKFDVHYLDEDDEEVDPSDARSVEVTLGLAVMKYNQEISTEYTVRTVFRN